MTFDSAPLPERLEILGAPVVELELAVDRPTAFLAVRLCDVAPDGNSVRASYGVLNLSHRRSHEDLEPMEPGRRERVRIQLNDTAWAFAEGHRLRIAVSTTYWPMVWPSPEVVTLTVFEGGALLLPVRPSRPGDEDLQISTDPETGRQADFTVVEPARLDRTTVTDAATGETVITNFSGAGRLRLELDRPRDDGHGDRHRGDPRRRPALVLGGGAPDVGAEARRLAHPPRGPCHAPRRPRRTSC